MTGASRRAAAAARGRPACARRSARAAAALTLALVLAGCASSLPSIHSEQERLELARRLHARGKYLQAVEALKAYIANSAGSAEVDGAIYLLGDSYLQAKEWVPAQTEFERVLREYPESDSAGSASFGLGAALEGQARPRDFDQEFTVKAIEQWQNYLRGYPDHWRNAQAQQRVLEARTRLARKLVDTGHLYLRLKEGRAARMYFDKVVSEYADTPALADAEFGVAMCMAWQGSTEDAIAQFRQIEARYPGQPVAARAATERRRIERD